MSSERRRGWGGAEEGQALRELAPLKCGCLGWMTARLGGVCQARRGLPGLAWLGLGLAGLAWAGQGDLDARSL